MANNDDPTDPLRRHLLAAGSLLSAAAAFWPRLSLASSHSEGHPMNADLILFNGQFHTVDREKPRASAVAISQGRFVAVGTDAEAMALFGVRDGERIDGTCGRPVSAMCGLHGQHDRHG